MTESLDATERLGAEGATHPRITLDYIKSQIEQQWFTTADRIPTERAQLGVVERLKHITVCLLLMRNGFCVIGKSAPLSPDNFDEEKGKTFAYEDAIRTLWPLMAFAQLEKDAAGKT
jgi:hypothetical protein